MAMTIQGLTQYRHSLFTVEPLNTDKLEIVKSKIYGGVEYVARDNQLVLLIDTSSVADASRDLWHALKGEKKPNQNDFDMFNDDNA
jgi:hypothetical protein